MSFPSFFRTSPGTASALHLPVIRPSARGVLSLVFPLLLALCCALTPPAVAQAGEKQAAPAGEQGTEPAPVPCFYSKSSYKKLPPKAQEVYAQLYEANMDFIKHGLANYYNTEDKSVSRRFDDVKKLYDLKDCHAFGLNIDMRPGGFYQLVDISAKSRSDIQMLASLGQFPGPRPDYNTEIARSHLYCDYQEEYNGRIYEYWYMMQSAWGTRCLYCEFFVTVAQSRGAERKIIHRANRFFRTYKVDENFSVVFPEDKYINHIRGSYTHCPFCPN